MRGIKPFKLGMMARPFEWGRKHHLGVSVLGYFAFDPPGALFADAQLWPDVADILGQDLTLDVGIPKSRSEVLVAGSAFAPGGAPAATVPVKVQVGGVQRSLYAIGDRVWRRGVPTAPAPFTRMPITWENAFGGEGYERNPRGKGLSSDDDQPLPNVELPGKLIDSPKARPEPASFMPIDFTWPQRFSMVGTYDQEWLDTRFPGFAADLDWRIWNAAAAEQQQEAPFAGNEPILVENMHPDKPRLTSYLPGLKGRAFITRVGSEALEEVELRCTTVWLFPELERGVVIFQGATPIVEDDAADVENLMIAAERLNQPRPFEHYEAVLKKRLDKERPEEVLNDADLVPEELAGLGAQVEEQMELTTHDGLRMKRQRKKAEATIEQSRADVASYGLDPDEHAASPLPPEEPLPTLTELPAYIAKVKQQAEDEKKRSEAQFEQHKERAAKLYEELGLDWEEVEEEMKTPHRGPPSYTAVAERAKFRQMADELAAAGTPSDELEHYATDEELFAHWQKFEERMWATYRAFAHFQTPVDRASEERSAELRAALEGARRAGEGRPGIDLTGADLSGLDLSGLDLSNALLEHASLARANLSGADLSGAVLAHADLSGARLRGATLKGANLGKATLAHADSEGEVDLEDAILWESDLTGARLTGAKLTGATLLRATLAEADLSHASGTELVFHEMELTGLKLTGASFKSCGFIYVNAREADFSGATLDESGFVGCQLDQCAFVNASMVNARFALDTRAPGADLKGADLSRANLRGVDLRGSDLSGATLTGADLSEANLEGSRLYRVVAKDSMWIRTVLKDAFLVSADLMNALLQKADLRGADLRGANLYGADFALVRSDDKTNVTDAIQLKARTRPAREDEHGP